MINTAVEAEVTLRKDNNQKLEPEIHENHTKLKKETIRKETIPLEDKSQEEERKQIDTG